MAKKENNKASDVYKTIQVGSSPEREDAGVNLITIDNTGNMVLAGENAYYDNNMAFSILRDKLVSTTAMGMKGNSPHTQLKSIFAGKEGGPWHVDPRDDGVTVHNCNFNQTPILSYTYNFGNGELISINVETKKKEAPAAVTVTSTIDPETKEVVTTVTQGFSGELKVPEYDVSELNKYGFKSPLGYNPTNQKYQNLWQIIQDKYNKWATPILNPDDKKKVKAKDYRFEDEVKESLTKDYIVTQKDVNDYFLQAKSTFDSLTASAAAGDVSALKKLMGTNSLAKFSVKKNLKVKEWVNPLDYSNWNNLSPEDQKFFGSYNSYNKGLKRLKEDPNIIVLAVKKKPEAYPDGREAGIVKHDKSVLILVDKEIEVQLDVARVFASAAPQMLQGELSKNDVIKNMQSQITADMQVIGRPNIESSKVIEVLGISERYSGKWYIKKAKHSMGTQGYLCDLDIVMNNPTDTIVSTKSNVNTVKTFGAINKIAKEKLAKGPIVDLKSEVRQKVKAWKKENKVDQANISVIVSPNNSIQIVPAKEPISSINNLRSANTTKK